MKKILTANWFVAVVGALAYLGTTAACFTAAKFVAPDGTEGMGESKMPVTESWNFLNPEIDKMVEELKRERESLALREQQLRELEGRLVNERQELGAVTQIVARLQHELEQSIVRVKQDEVPNLKKLAKIHASM